MSTASPNPTPTATKAPKLGFLSGIVANVETLVADAGTGVGNVVTNVSAGFGKLLTGKERAAVEADLGAVTAGLQIDDAAAAATIVPAAPAAAPAADVAPATPAVPATS